MPVPRMIMSRSRPPAAATHVAEALGADLVEMGSAGAKTMAVIRGECEIYAHSGGILRLDKDSNVLWASEIRAHHDLQVQPDGRIYVLTSVNRVVPRVNPKHAVLTNMHIDLDYATLDAETPDHVEPGYDGMVIEQDLS